jgi:signal peptidase I
LPTDACRELHGKPIRRGETLWKGAIITGDFIFVNRWKWNFVKPQNEEVMIFSTTGIDQLPQGTHYIKRMKARPGETYELEHPVQGYPAKVTMGDGEYFACGDNFNNSFDSRYWGSVPRENLRGVASVVFWPINGWRIIK